MNTIIYTNIPSKQLPVVVQCNNGESIGFYTAKNKKHAVENYLSIVAIWKQKK